MYIYNKDEKSYTFSFDELEIENLVTTTIDKNITENHNNQKQIEIIDGGNDLNISPVTDYLEIEKPTIEKKDNIIIPEDNK